MEIEARRAKKKILGGALWAGTSLLFFLWSRRIHRVWLDGSDIIFSRGGSEVKIPLTDVTGMSETRGQRVKAVKLTLRTGSPVGPTLHFIPRHQLQAPSSEHPMIRELKERKRLLAGESGDRRLAL